MTTALAKREESFGLLVRSEALTPEELDTLQAELARFLNRLVSPNSRRAYRNDWAAWTGFLESLEIHPQDAKPVHVEAYVTMMREECDPPASTSQQRRLAVIKAIYAMLTRAGVIPSNPARESRITGATTTNTPVLTKEEYLRILQFDPANEIEERALMLALTAGLTGLRRSSISSLRVADFQPGSSPRLTIHRAKGGKTSVLAVPKRLGDALTRWVASLPAEAPLFSRMTGDASAGISEKTVRRAFALIATRVGLREELATPHAMRRSFATHSYAAGVPLEEIQSALMHATPQITLRYIKLSISALHAPGDKMLAHLEGP